MKKIYYSIISLCVFSLLFLITNSVFADTKKLTNIAPKIIYQNLKTNSQTNNTNIKNINLDKNSRIIYGCSFNNPKCNDNQQCVNNICKYNWEIALDALVFPNYSETVDSEGNLVLRSGNYLVRVPNQNAKYYAKFRLNTTIKCSERVRLELGVNDPYAGNIIANTTKIDSYNGSYCCGPAPEYTIMNLNTQESFNFNAHSNDAYWKNSLVNMNNCLGGHEEVHRFVRNSSIPRWANEGLAAYIERKISMDPGSASSSGLVSCGDNTFRTNSFTEGYVEADIPYRNVLTEFDEEPGIYSYYTAACFWDYIAKNYGDNKIKEIVRKLYSAPSNHEDNFIQDSVVPVTGNGIWTFLEKIGIHR